MRESQIKEIKAYYASKLKNNNASADVNTNKNEHRLVSKPFFNSVLDKLNVPPQK